jgi:hypothetical protein
MIKHSNFPLAIGILFPILSGCGSNDVQVSGTVRYEGQPLPLGIVSFQPESAKTAQTVRIRPDGTYVIAKVPVGAVRVAVSTESRSLAPSPPTPDSSPPERPKPPPIPKRYGKFEESGLSFVIQRGAQKYDIDLQP